MAKGKTKRKANPQATAAMKLYQKGGVTLKQAWAQVKSGRKTRKATKRASREAARRQPGETRRAHAGRTYHRTKKGILNMSLGQATEAYIAVDALVDAYQGAKANMAFYKTNELGAVGSALGLVKTSGSDPVWDKHATSLVAGPLVDGAIAVKAFHAARTSKLTDGFVKSIFNLRPLGGLKLPHMTPGILLKAAPSAAGWVTAAKSYANIKNYLTGKVLLPRVNTMLGIKIDANTYAVSLDKAALARVALPIAAGGVGSMIVGKIEHSAVVPAPVKPLLNISITN